MTSTPARILISLFLSSSFTAIGVAQQPSIEELNTPAVRVTTRLVLVDTVVTDKSGQRIRDLKKEDFTVLENGKAQKISAFSFEASAVAPRQALELPPNVHTNRPEYDMPKGPLMIMLLDGLNTPVADQGYARAQMLTYLGSQLQPGQPLSVYTLAGSLRLLQDFTGDVSLLKAAVDHFTPQKSLEMQVQNTISLLPNLPVSGLGVGGHADSLRLVFTRMSEFMSEQTKFAIDGRVQRTAAAMRLLARRMSGYPGRKNLIWVSAGFPIDITSEVVQLTTDVDMLAQGNTVAAPQVRVEKSYEELLHQLAAELTDAQVSVYSVDARASSVRPWPTQAAREPMKLVCSEAARSMAPR